MMVWRLSIADKVTPLAQYRVLLYETSRMLYAQYSRVVHHINLGQISQLWNLKEILAIVLSLLVLYRKGEER